MILIGEMPVKPVRMAHVAIVGSHYTNVMAAMHSELLRTTVVKDFGDTS
jgi:glycogen phosphorylase